MRSGSTAACRRVTTSSSRTGVTVVVDPFSAPYLQGAEVDFLNTITESGFKISNPNAVSACGCGHSFQVEEGEELPEGTEVGGCGSGCSH